MYHLQPSGKFVIGGPQVSERGGEGRGMIGVCVV